MGSSRLLGNLAPLLPEATLPSMKRDPPLQATKSSTAERRWLEPTVSRRLSPPLHRRMNTKLAPVVYFSSPASGGGGSGSDREQDLRNGLRELEEMKELEKLAEELLSLRSSDAAEEEGERVGEDGDDEEKRERVRRELEKLAKEQAERRETAELMFELGKKAYGKGMYARAIEFLEAALTIIPRVTLFGGEIEYNEVSGVKTEDLTAVITNKAVASVRAIQIWLAMAYEANNRHRDCIVLYQQLEKKHPYPNIRRQAAELKYILQAPKLKISKDEMVTIPLIGSSYDRYAGTWSDKYKNADQRRTIGSTTSQLPSSRNILRDLMMWRPPVGFKKNTAFWTLLAFWIGLLGSVFLLQR
ncbi:hypothetical protein KSP39_PZI022141 [Platanthera zijinensis]|uniref:Uncharacterized protein n=1 Tax=Platanthera zijinensis TaxID=2320716 RepID=A0AAP0AYT4_9ASPA